MHKPRPKPRCDNHILDITRQNAATYDRYDKSPLMESERDDDADVLAFGGARPAAAPAKMSDAEIEARALKEKNAPENTSGRRMFMNAKERMKDWMQRMRDARDFRRDRPRLATRTLASLDHEYNISPVFEVDENAFKSLWDENDEEII